MAVRLKYWEKFSEPWRPEPLETEPLGNCFESSDHLIVFSRRDRCSTLSKNDAVSGY